MVRHPYYCCTQNNLSMCSHLLRCGADDSKREHTSHGKSHASAEFHATHPLSRSMTSSRSLRKPTAQQHTQHPTTQHIPKKKKIGVCGAQNPNLNVGYLKLLELLTLTRGLRSCAVRRRSGFTHGPRPHQQGTSGPRRTRDNVVHSLDYGRAESSGGLQIAGACCLPPCKRNYCCC